MQNRHSIFTLKLSPYWIAGGSLVLILLGQCLVWAFSQPDSNKEKLDYWIVSASFLLFYTFFISMFSFSSKDRITYYGRSVFGFILTALLGGVMAYLFSGISLMEADSLSWIYLVLGIVFLVFITIVNLMRKLLDMVLKQDKNLRNEE